RWSPIWKLPVAFHTVVCVALAMCTPLTYRSRSPVEWVYVAVSRVHAPRVTLPGAAAAVSYVVVLVLAADSPKRHELSLASAQSLKPAAWVPSWDSTVPPVAFGFTRAEMVKSALVASAEPAVDSAPLPPPPGVMLKATSGLWTSPVCQATSPV